jgi:hypothetical protein
MKTQRPAWWVLYSLLPLAVAALVAVSLWIPAGAGRVFAQATVSFAILGGMALWVRTNRVALALLDASEEAEAPFRAWVACQPPLPHRRQLVAQASEADPRIAA